MTSLTFALAFALALGAAPEDAAPPETAAAAPAEPPAAIAAQGPDVELHVPRAEVAKLGLEVENLQARLDLETNVATLVRIQAGVVATVQKLKVQMEGVEAETHLLVRLDRVTRVMERALGSIDRHPDLAGAPGAPAEPALRALPAVSVDAGPGAAEPSRKPEEE